MVIRVDGLTNTYKTNKQRITNDYTDKCTKTDDLVQPVISHE